MRASGAAARNRQMNGACYPTGKKLLRSGSMDEKLPRSFCISENFAPQSYDSWPAAKKRQRIEACLQDYGSGYGGMRIEDFRSPVVEAYLEKAGRTIAS